MDLETGETHRFTGNIQVPSADRSMKAELDAMTVTSNIPFAEQIAEVSSTGRKNRPQEVALRVQNRLCAQLRPARPFRLPIAEHRSVRAA